MNAAKWSIQHGKDQELKELYECRKMVHQTQETWKLPKGKIDSGDKLSIKNKKN